jgi:hypothetical protein
MSAAIVNRCRSNPLHFHSDARFSLNPVVNNWSTTMPRRVKMSRPRLPHLCLELWSISDFMKRKNGVPCPALRSSDCVLYQCLRAGMRGLSVGTSSAVTLGKYAMPSKSVISVNGRNASAALVPGL